MAAEWQGSMVSSQRRERERFSRIVEENLFLWISLYKTKIIRSEVLILK